MKEPKFRRYQTVIVDGTATGLGNLTGIILSVEYLKLSKEYFYLVKTEKPFINKVQASERHLSIPNSVMV